MRRRRLPPAEHSATASERESPPEDVDHTQNQTPQLAFKRRENRLGIWLSSVICFDDIWDTREGTLKIFDA